jgi:hypothetical protein
MQQRLDPNMKYGRQDPHFYFFLMMYSTQQHLPAQLSYFHYQQPPRPAQPPPPPVVVDFEAYEPEPVNPLRAALDAAERQKAKAERLSGTLTRVLETLVTETACGGTSPTLARLLAASDGGCGVFSEVLAMQREWDAAAAASVVPPQQHQHHHQQHQHQQLHELDFPGDIDFFGTNEGLVFSDPTRGGELCLRAP